MTREWATLLHLHVDGIRVCEVEVADTFLRRLRGMLLRRQLPPALLLLPGGGVHGHGMLESLDVAMLRPESGQKRCRSATALHRVVKVRVLRPFAMVSGARGVCAVLEAPAGSFERWGLGEASTVEARPA